MSRTVTKLFVATTLLIATAFLPQTGQAISCCVNCQNALDACQAGCHTIACQANCNTSFNNCGRRCGGICPV